MTLVELAKLVVEMLDAQQKYFKSRTTEDLRASKYVEAKLRSAADRIVADSEGLFGEAPNGT